MNPEGDQGEKSEEGGEGGDGGKEGEESERREEGGGEEGRGEGGGSGEGRGEGGGVGEEREGERGQGNNEGRKEDHDEGNDVVADIRDYKFSDADIERQVGPPVALDQSYNKESRERLQAIEQHYSTLANLRSEINALLAGFKQRLDHKEEATLNMCFEKMRELVGKYEILKLNKREMKIMISDEAQDDAVEAANKFNMMLEKCHELQEKVCISKQVMEEKLQALERDKQFQSTLDAIHRAKKQLELVREWDKHVNNIISDTKSSSKKLAPKKITGLQQELDEA